MDTIEIRDADSAYKYAFMLIDMLANYVFIIPVKDICGKILVHEYIYKVFLPFGRMEKFLSDNGMSFINKDWRNLALRNLEAKHFLLDTFSPAQETPEQTDASKTYTIS